MSPTPQRRELNTHTTHEGRPIPPDGWSIETTPGWGATDQNPGFTRIHGEGPDIPTRFVLTVGTDDAPPIRMALFYAVDPDGVTLEAVKSHPIDVVAATDLLRKYAPIDKWTRLAIVDLGVRMAVHEAIRAGDAEKTLQAMGFSEDAARQVLEIFGPGATWATSQTTNIGSISLDDPAWQSALGTWRNQLQSREFTENLKDMATRRAPRRNRVTPEHLAEVAEIYRAADKQGRPPTVAVAEHFGASHRTATRWVGAARDIGLLGPAVTGKGGERIEEGQDGEGTD